VCVLGVNMNLEEKVASWSFQK